MRWYDKELKGVQSVLIGVVSCKIESIKWTWSHEIANWVNTVSFHRVQLNSSGVFDRDFLYKNESTSY